MSERPDLSIVLAVTRPQAAALDAYLSVIEPQLTSRVELIAVLEHTDVAMSTLDRAGQGQRSSLFERVIVSDRNRLAPELWALGVECARGTMVTVTIPSCLPSDSWVNDVLAADWDAIAGIGGPIELAAGTGAVGCAVYFVRYSGYMLPFATRSVTEIPGDNGTYRRKVLDRHAAWIRAHGFWETPLNRRLRAEGETLRMQSNLVVFHQNPFTVAGFSRQRIRHGLVFGRHRAAAGPAVRTAALIVLEPIVPLLMLARITRTVLGQRRHVGRYVVALPFTLWFLCCWAAGEGVGLVIGLFRAGRT